MKKFTYEKEFQVSKNSRCQRIPGVKEFQVSKNSRCRGYSKGARDVKHVSDEGRVIDTQSLRILHFAI